MILMISSSQEQEAEGDELQRLRADSQRRYEVELQTLDQRAAGAGVQGFIANDLSARLSSLREQVTRREQLAAHSETNTTPATSVDDPTGWRPPYAYDPPATSRSMPAFFTYRVPFLQLEPSLGE